MRNTTVATLQTKQKSLFQGTQDTYYYLEVIREDAWKFHTSLYHKKVNPPFCRHLL
jgi:hypothetical protein